jgi:hypothetical protein
MALVEGQYAARPELTRKDGDREIRQTDVEIGVSPIELQPRRVDDERHLPKPSRSSSSATSEIGRGSSSIRAKPAASAKLRSPLLVGT